MDFSQVKLSDSVDRIEIVLVDSCTDKKQIYIKMRLHFVNPNIALMFGNT